MKKHTKLRTVYVVGEYSIQVEKMFDAEQGYLCTPNADFADIICWTGGPDIHPRLYNQEKLSLTSVNDYRDSKDIEVYNKYALKDKLFVGICRGGQFLNVMAGGSMWQDVHGHRNGPHMAIDLLSGDRFRVTSTHHQMMNPSPEGEVLCVAFEADEVRDDKRHYKLLVGRTEKERRPKGDFPTFDPEVVYYKKNNSLCFQPHPEYDQSPPCRQYFFELIEQLS